MSNKFLISCDEATTICNKSQYKEASFWEQVKLSFHIFMCKTCSLYSKQNNTLTKVCNKHLHKDDGERKLCNQEKEVIQSEISKKLNSNS